MENTRNVEFPSNCIRLCFDEYTTEVCKGKVCGTTLKDEKLFQSMEEMVIVIDNAFNEIGQPQSCQVLRSFREQVDFYSYKGSPSRYHDSIIIQQRKGIVTTIDLVMISRHHAEWQGVLKSIDGKNLGRFDSILECLSLLEKIILEKDKTLL